MHTTGTCIGQKATLFSFLFSVVRSHCGALVELEFTTMSKISQTHLLLLPNAGVRGDDTSSNYLVFKLYLPGLASFH